jgi:hypothetical protein
LGAGELARLLPEFAAPPFDVDPEMARARLFPCSAAFGIV